MWWFLWNIVKFSNVFLFSRSCCGFSSKMLEHEIIIILSWKAYFINTTKPHQEVFECQFHLVNNCSHNCWSLTSQVALQTTRWSVVFCLQQEPSQPCQLTESPDTTRRTTTDWWVAATAMSRWTVVCFPSRSQHPVCACRSDPRWSSTVCCSMPEPPKKSSLWRRWVAWTFHSYSINLQPEPSAWTF